MIIYDHPPKHIKSCKIHILLTIYICENDDGNFRLFSSSFRNLLALSIMFYVVHMCVRACVCGRGGKRKKRAFCALVPRKTKFCFLSPSSDRHPLPPAALSSSPTSYRRFSRRFSATFPLSTEVYRKLSSSLLTIVISFIVVYANSFVENLTGDQVEYSRRLDLWFSKIFITRFLKLVYSRT